MKMISSENLRRLPLGMVLAIGWTVNGQTLPCLPAPVFVDNGGVYTEGIPNLPVGNNGYTHPEDNPTPPGDVFNPPVTTSAPAAGAPAITAFTPQAGSDNTVLMQGGAFTTYVGNDTGMDTRLWSTDTNGLVYQPQILLVTNQALAVLMSPPSGNYGMYLTWVGNSNGVSYPVRVNGSDAWWIGPDHAVAGSSVSVYGRNLSYQNGTTSSWVYIRPWGSNSNTVSTPCTVLQVNPYKVTFTVPGNLSAGAYEVWIHNGHGGQYGWSGPLEFIVDATAAYQWNGTVHNVKSYGAYGDGVHIDSLAIQSAINACSPGDIVYLPAGTYMITNRLNLWNGVAIEGAGAAKTTIATYSSSYDDVAMLNSHWVSTNLVSSLTLSNGYAGATLEWGMYVADYGDFPGVPYGIIISSCNFATAQNVNNLAISIVGVQDVWVTNCTFTMSGDGVDLGCEQAFVNNNTFYGNADTNAPTGFGCTGGKECDYSDNIAASLSRTNNQTVARFFTSGSNGSVVRNVYVGDNICSSCGPLPTDPVQNAGEMILWEDENVHFTGAPSAVGATTLTYTNVSWTSNEFVSAILYVDNGPGRGAWRTIVANTTNTLTVDHAWDVWPTTYSHTVLTYGGAHTVTYQNYLDGLPNYHTSTTACSGVQPGTSFDTVVANNTITEAIGALNFGSNLEPTNQQDREAVGTQCNNLIINNVVSNCVYGISCGASIWATGSGPTNFGPIVLNNVFRDNFITNVDDTGISISKTYDTWNWPWQQYNLFEYNTVVDCSNSYVMEVGSQQGYTLIRKNYFSNNYGYTTLGLNFDLQSVCPYLYQNYISPQLGGPYGTLPGAGQNLGTRCFDLIGTVGGASPAAQSVTLWNIGTATLNVSISTNQSWLSASVSPASITALTTNSTATVTLNVKSAGLGVGTYTGTVTVTGGSYATPETMSVTLWVMAPFVITSITESGNNVNLVWTATGGTTNVVQAMNGDLNGSFRDISSNLAIAGSGVVTNTYTDTGGATNDSPRFYRIRLQP